MVKRIGPSPAYVIEPEEYRGRPEYLPKPFGPLWVNGSLWRMPVFKIFEICVTQIRIPGALLSGKPLKTFKIVKRVLLLRIKSDQTISSCGFEG